MRAKKEYLILIAIIIAAGLYLVLHKKDQTQYTLPTIAKIEIDTVTRLEIKTPAETIGLYKKDKQWFIAPHDFPADGAKVKGMLFEIEEIVLTDLVSESKAYVRYQLDDKQKITVSAWAEDKLIRDFAIGKEAATFQHTFMRLPENPNVYHARGDFRRKFEETAAALRDHEVLAFDPDALQTIRLTNGGATLQLKRIEPPAPDQSKSEADGLQLKVPAEPVWQTTTGRSVEPASLESFLNAINNLKCENYIAGRQKAEFKSPQFEIVLAGKETYTLKLFAKENEKDGELPAISSYNAYPFTLSSDRLQSWQKTFAKLAGKEETAKKE